MLSHILNDVLDCNVDGVLNDSFVEVPNDVLNHAELLEEFATCVQNFMREDVLLSVDP